MSPAPARLSRLPRPVRWFLLILLSTLLIAPMAAIQLPASFMLGAMIAAIALQVSGAELKLARGLLLPAEGLLGVLLAAAITPAALATFTSDAPLFLAIGLAILALSTVVSWGLLRSGRLPGSTAVWGLSPGAATVMMLMSEAFGADQRLVAFMQYLRVLIVAIVAPLIAHFWGAPGGAGPTAAAAAGAGLDWFAFGQSLAITALGIALALATRMPGGTILLPFALGGVLHAAGLVSIQLPDMLMSVCYVLLGWSVGQSFTMQALRHAVSVLPQVLGSILLMIALCIGLGALVSWGLGIDALSAYLATSPGGLSSVAIIAATSRVDLAFVIAMQTLRFVLVLLLGPPLARLLAARAA
ncbi:AbrB family transcriptional regulator [Acidimangrovimonas pyrenivorans]|uniref:AbrB family transcriptional regulator n=1 Tax=Acidimangrovimonas pyrenivorans TaxID=2030798 RepID=A0ABV7AJ24_9RHOB